MCPTANDVQPTVQQITELCYNKFHSLTKTSKPTNNQWTVLAGIVQHDKRTQISKVVSLATGTKCIGHNKLCARGFILNDSHAEVLARRAFLRYVHNELLKAAKRQKQDAEDTIFSWQPTTACFVLDEQLEFHFLSTQTPCGDACIVADSNDDFESLAKRQRLEVDDNELCREGLPLSFDCAIYTGAKLISRHTELGDDMLQTPAALRTKPGRGERTLSMSCSDKLSRWNMMGVQDAHLENLKRAIYQRWHSNKLHRGRFQPQEPVIRIDSTLTFEYAQRADWQPSPSCLIWAQLPETLRPYEIAVNGKRQGVTKKNLNTPQAALSISKYKLLLNFLDLLHCCTELREKFHLQLSDLDSLTYASCKAMAEDYQSAWQQLKCTLFQQWTRKPNNLLDFTKQTD